jgi:hypothetical protein
MKIYKTCTLGTRCGGSMPGLRRLFSLRPIELIADRTCLRRYRSEQRYPERSSISLNMEPPARVSSWPLWIAASTTLTPIFVIRHETPQRLLGCNTGTVPRTASRRYAQIGMPTNNDTLPTKRQKEASVTGRRIVLIAAECFDICLRRNYHVRLHGSAR